MPACHETLLGPGVAATQTRDVAEFHSVRLDASSDVSIRIGGQQEVVRGLLYHRYWLAEDGAVVRARIAPPTSQNQAQIEDDLRRFVEPRLALDTPELTWRCEQAIRNYDLCISCVTHFLDLQVVEA